MIRLSSRRQGHTDLLCSSLPFFFFFFWNLEGMYPWLVSWSLFWQDMKLCWTPCYSRAVSQSALGSWLLSYSSQFGSNKTLFYSCFPDGSDSKESSSNAGDLGSNPGLRTSPGGGHGNPLQYSGLENPMDRGAWQDTYSPWGRKELDTTEWLSLSLLLLIAY